MASKKELILYEYQKKAIDKLKSGNILLGDVGTGKTLTSLVFYRSYFLSRPLYVITTAKKRDSKDWEAEANLIGINDISVDSWNNIRKYANVTDAFFIFDEQKVSGFGPWSKTFINLAKRNKWILLSATPGDVWIDYMAVFIANGFYRNKTDFVRQHVVYSRFTKYPKIQRYINEDKLLYLRKQIVVPMRKQLKTERKDHYYICQYNKVDYDKALKNRWDIYKDEPIQNVPRLMQVIRKVVNSDEDRIRKATDILKNNSRVIVFYNYNYELAILEDICATLGKTYSQWNGHKHEEIPKDDEWVYICHYASAEGWNCIETNVVLFYSLNYSYKVMEQAKGRIDRVNTNYILLHYHFLMSKSSVDNAILKALKTKKIFNEASFLEKN